MAIELLPGSRDTSGERGSTTAHESPPLRLLDPDPSIHVPDSLIPATAAGRRQWLVQREGSFWERGRILEFPARIGEGTIGRSFSCTWRFNDGSVSRIHAALVRRARRGVYLVDLASRSGTFVNDRRVEGEILLMDGDRIRLGPQVVLEYVDGPRPRPTTRPERWVKRVWWSLAGLGGLLALLAVVL